jgi:hypothetical protein
MNYKRYAKYKDSGVEWLGEIPDRKYFLNKDEQDIAG